MDNNRELAAGEKVVW